MRNDNKPTKGFQTVLVCVYFSGSLSVCLNLSSHLGVVSTRNKDEDKEFLAKGPGIFYFYFVYLFFGSSSSVTIGDRLWIHILVVSSVSSWLRRLHSKGQQLNVKGCLSGDPHWCRGSRALRHEWL